MKERGFVEGTVGITYVHKKDDRRHRKRCTHYRKDGSCGYMSKCGGASQCMFYEEEDSEVEFVYNRKKSTIKEVPHNKTPQNEKCSVKRVKGAERFSGAQSIKLSEIVVPKKFANKTPSAEKVRALYDYYEIHKKMDKPIFVSLKDGKYYLEDKYLRYYVSKELGKTWISARIGTQEESKLYDRLLTAGERVRHKLFGIGTIKESDGKYINVKFDSGKIVKFNFDRCMDDKLLL